MKRSRASFATALLILAVGLPAAWAQLPDRLPSLPLPGGVPFIPVGPQPGAVPVNSEGWRSVVKSFGPPMSGRQAKLVEEAVAELSRAAGRVGRHRAATGPPCSTRPWSTRSPSATATCS